MSLQAFAPWLGAIEIILAVVLTTMVILQSKGNDMSSFMGGGGSSDTFRTRRGLEAVMHNWTIYFSIAFFANTLLCFIAWGQAA